MEKFYHMKIISRFKIHPLFYLAALICIFTGLFKDFYYITLIILVHELGHIIVSLYYKWRIDKIVILPFGGITIFNECLNKPIKEESLVAIAGPIFQVLTFSFFKNPLLIKYHYFLLFFNLLPIIPLDGSKILNVIFNKICSFKKSYLYTIIISFIMILLCFLNFSKYPNLVWFIVIFFLLFKVIIELKKYHFIVNKFLFERYLYRYNFKKSRMIKGSDLTKIKKDYKHIFYYDKNYYTERELLDRMFDKII